MAVGRNIALFGLCLLLASPVLRPEGAGAEVVTRIAIEGPPPAAVPKGFATLYRFTGGKNGRWPRGAVAFDGTGNLYGTTFYGGQRCSNCGIIYQLKPASGVSLWTFKKLYQFGKTLQDGIGPTAPLLFHDGAFYGTTAAGADPTCGCGEVFKFTPPDGAHPLGTYQILHHFSPSKIGSTPIGGLLIDGDTIYGTTSAGGKHGAGTVFKIGTSGGGFSVLHDFVGGFNGGPQGELIFGNDGAIYGTTYGGGKYNQGTIFRITKGGSFTVLYNFLGVDQPGGSHDGAQPEGRLALAPDGTIYGTTTFGGSVSGYGTAWSFKPSGKTRSATGVYKQLQIFGSAGNLPHSGFVRAKDGSLYGTGAGGGKFQEGVIYKLTPPKSGNKWNYTLLHSFKGRDKDGDTPYGDLVLRAGVLYGTTLTGGKFSGTCGDGCGTVFRFKL
jgi:uncharacterized repeat protein (TIGR03803 family)